jgi:hypothetical protein
MICLHLEWLCSWSQGMRWIVKCYQTFIPFLERPLTPVEAWSSSESANQFVLATSPLRLTTSNSVLRYREHAASPLLKLTDVTEITALVVHNKPNILWKEYRDYECESRWKPLVNVVRMREMWLYIWRHSGIYKGLPDSRSFYALGYQNTTKTSWNKYS